MWMIYTMKTWIKSICTCGVYFCLRKHALLGLHNIFTFEWPMHITKVFVVFLWLFVMHKKTEITILLIWLSCREWRVYIHRSCSNIMNLDNRGYLCFETQNLLCHFLFTNNVYLISIWRLIGTYGRICFVNNMLLNYLNYFSRCFELNKVFFLK